MSNVKRQVWVRAKHSDDWVVAEEEEKTKTTTVYRLLSGAVLTENDIEQVGPELSPPADLSGENS